MSSSATATLLPHPLACLERMCRTYPTVRKVVFAPSAQGGRAVQHALAAAGPHRSTSRSPPSARTLPSGCPDVLAGGRRALPIFSEGFILDGLLGDGGAGGAAPAPRLLALRETVDALRMAGLDGSPSARGRRETPPTPSAWAAWSGSSQVTAPRSPEAAPSTVPTRYGLRPSAPSGRGRHRIRST